MVGLYAILLGNIRRVERLICGRVSEYHGDIGSQTIGHRKARRGVPLILNIQTKLCRSYICCRVAYRIVADILASLVLQEVIERVVGVCTQRISHIEARGVENLVVRTYGNSVRVGIVGEVIGQRYGVLHQIVHNGKGVCANIDRGVVAIAHLLNLHIGILRSTHCIATIVYAGVAHTELVKHLLRYARVQLRYQRVGIGNRGVALAIEAQERSTRHKLIFSRIEEVVAKREVVA